MALQRDPFAAEKLSHIMHLKRFALSNDSMNSQWYKLWENSYYENNRRSIRIILKTSGFTPISILQKIAYNFKILSPSR